MKTQTTGLKAQRKNGQRRKSVPLAWMKAAGMWKKKKPDPLKHLKALRKEW